MRLKLLAFLLLFASPVWVALDVQSNRTAAACGERVLERDRALSRQLERLQSDPAYVAPEKAVFVSMID